MFVVGEAVVLGFEPDDDDDATPCCCFPPLPNGTAGTLNNTPAASFFPTASTPSPTGTPTGRGSTLAPLILPGPNSSLAGDQGWRRKAMELWCGGGGAGTGAAWLGRDEEEAGGGAGRGSAVLVLELELE